MAGIPLLYFCLFFSGVTVTSEGKLSPSGWYRLADGRKLRVLSGRINEACFEENKTYSVMDLDVWSSPLVQCSTYAAIDLAL